MGRYDDGNPAVLEKSLGLGRVMLVTSSFSLAWNDLPIRGVFLPFLYQTVDYLGGRLGRSGGEQYYVIVGETIRLASTRSTTVTNPDGKTITVTGSADETSLFTDTDRPGLYTVGAGGRTDTFAVNLDTEESDISRVDIEEFVASVINPVTESQEAKEMKAQASFTENKEVERRQKLWWYLSLTLLLVVLGETFLASRTHR